MILPADSKSKHRSAYRVRLSMVDGTGLTGLGVAARPLLSRVRGQRLSLSGPVLTRSRFVRPFAPVAERR